MPEPQAGRHPEPLGAKFRFCPLSMQGLRKFGGTEVPAIDWPWYQPVLALAALDTWWPIRIVFDNPSVQSAKVSFCGATLHRPGAKKPRPLELPESPPR